MAYAATKRQATAKGRADWASTLKRLVSASTHASATFLRMALTPDDGPDNLPRSVNSRRAAALVPTSSAHTSCSALVPAYAPTDAYRAPPTDTRAFPVLYQL
eukprot:2317487-Rhodomonas_salina.1